MAETSLQKYFEGDLNCDIFDQFKEHTSKAEIRDLWIIPEIDLSTKLNTVPAVSVELLNDPIAAAINVHCPSEIANRRKHANHDSLTIDDQGIRNLISDGCYRSAIALTSRLLSNYGQGLNQKGQGIKHTIHSLQLWQARISLLIKIGETEIARKEAEPFGQLSNYDMFYDFTEEQQFKSRKGSLASFSFRLLLAHELPLKLSRAKEALQNLIPIMSTTKKIYTFFKDVNSAAEMEFWKERIIRVFCCIVNCATHLKNFDLASQTYESLLALPDLTEELKFEICSFWGRTYLQCGDILSAEKKFGMQQLNTSSKRKLTLHVNKGLLAVAQNDYNEAFQSFQKAHEIDKNNIMVLNNLAVCYLYNGKMHEAIKVYENAINSDPKNNLHETLLLNCATLYELESNDSKKRKIELLKIVSANRADLEMNIDLCLKL